MQSLPDQSTSPRLSVIVPARDEEDVLGACLDSLKAQSKEGFLLGTEWELLVVDDHSTDRTREIASQVEGVVVLDPEPLRPGWTGKANALWTAAKQSHGEWLLFTDADTIHQQEALERAMREAEDARAALLSYSPLQLVSGFWQHALMPLVFSELALAYPPAKVSDPASRVAAANGQFLMIRRDVYFAIGGHSAVAGSMLEDVDLAFLVKRRKYPIRFRYAPDAVSTRMYRSNRSMIEGWTKNLARLFSNPITLAAWRALDLMLLIALPLLTIAYFPFLWVRLAFAGLWLRVLWRFYSRVRRSNFPPADCAVAFFALPLFCFLLVRSWFHHSVKKQVMWKGRQYSTVKK
ncbi:MAG TPA: glycosyltransferase [Acidobacteriaceae bacterium]